MKPPGLIEKLDDAINPIVVKELRQAVHSRFVVAVVLLFLIVQLVYLGIHLTYVGLGGQLESIEYQEGRNVFFALQIILLATCMLFLPTYAGVRLAAERSEVNTDLLFITTLQSRKIISGKLASSVILAILIFSACAPFMAFTYFLRGIDLPSIFFVVLLDFLVVLGSVHLMIFLAVIPANRVLKAFIGLVGFGILVVIFVLTLVGTFTLVQFGLSSMFEDREFWVICACAFMAYVASCGLLYSWAVALISAPSANRAVAMRTFMFVYALVAGVLTGLLSHYAGHDTPFMAWIMAVCQLSIICLLIAINERTRWSPRVARTIPKSPLLRLPAFLVYSGAAGGVLFAALLMGMAALGLVLFEVFVGYRPVAGLASRFSLPEIVFRIFGILTLYIYCYGMAAVLVRTWLLPGLPHVFTWVVLVFVLAFCSLAPFLLSFLLFFRDWRYETHFYWLLANPGAAVYEFGERHSSHRDVFLIFAGVWAIAVTALNLPWFFQQLRAFRPPGAAGGVAPPVPALDGTSSLTQPLSK